MNKTIYLGIMLFSLIFSGNLSAQFQLETEGDARVLGNLNVDNGEYRSFGPVIFRPDSDNTGDDAIIFNDNTETTKMIIRNDGNVGIGLDNPTQLLHVQKGVSGVGGVANVHLIVESDDQAFISLKTPEDDGSGVIFGKPSSSLSGGIFYDFQMQNGLEFRTNANFADVVIDDSGNMGFNTYNPGAQLHIKMNSTSPSAGIRLEQNTNTNYWDMRVNGNDLVFEYNGVQKGYIDNGIMGFVNGSDRRLKKNIEYFENVLEKVMQLRPATYHYKAVEHPERKAWGFIAQEVEEVFPEMVFHKEGYRGLAYAEFAILAIKAIQELNDKVEKEKTTKEASIAQNEALIAKVNELESQMATIQNLDALLEKANALEAKLAALNQLEQKVKQIESDVDFCCQSQGSLDIKSESQTDIVLTEETAKLEQNQPNPFNGETIIKYFLPKSNHNAQIQITDINGKILKVENNLTTGYGSIILDAKSMSNGTYSYSLIVDGQFVETKRMILTK